MNPLIPLIRPMCGNFGAFLLARGVDEDFPLETFLPAQTIERKTPILLDVDEKLRARFTPHLRSTLEPLMIARYAGGWATADGSHISRENRLIEKISIHYEQTVANHPALTALRPFRKIKHHKGRLVSLTGKAPYNYYHWMLEILPKWGILGKYFDNHSTLYAAATRPFQKSSLELISAKIGEKNILNTSEYPVIYADEIVAAGVPLPLGHPHPWAVNFVRELFLKTSPLQNKTPENIFLSRQSAVARRIENFPEIENWCAKNNFTIVELEKLSLNEQINTFRNAKFVIAPHGAGLTNLIFSRPGTRIIEIVGDDEMHPEPFCFWALGNVLDLTYGVLAAKSLPHPTKVHEKNYCVDTGKLDSLREKLASL